MGERAIERVAVASLTEEDVAVDVVVWVCFILLVKLDRAEDKVECRLLLLWWVPLACLMKIEDGLWCGDPT